MKLYIYDYLEAVTSRYHDEGAVIIASASGPGRAWRTYAKQTNEDRQKWEDPVRESIAGEEPDRVVDISDDTPEFVQVFPDAGCC